MSKQLNISPALYAYILEHSLKESAALAALRHATEALPHAQMLSTPDCAQFIAWLLSVMQAKKVIEVGVYTGYTTLAMAEALPIDGQVIACDITDEHLRLGRPYWQQAGVDSKIEVRIAPAQETLQHLIDAGQQGKFDLIFVDANKQGYREYYEQALVLVRLGGVILLDNMLWSGRVADVHDQSAITQHLRALTIDLHQDSRIAFSLLPLADGLGMCRRIRC